MAQWITWIQFASTTGGMVFVALLAIDRWVHARDISDVNAISRFGALEKRVGEISAMVETGNQRSSQAFGKINVELIALRNDVVRLKTFEEVRWNANPRRQEERGTV